MTRAAELISEKVLSLSDEQLAEVNQFIETFRHSDDRALIRASAVLSKRSFEAIWNNPEDDIYDAL